MMLSIQDDKPMTDTFGSDFGSRNQDDWYSDAGDEVFVLDFDGGNALDAESAADFASKDLFEEVCLNDAGPLSPTMISLFEGNFLEATKETMVRSHSPVPAIDQSNFQNMFQVQQSKLSTESIKEKTKKRRPLISTEDDGYSNIFSSDVMQLDASIRPKKMLKTDASKNNNNDHISQELKGEMDPGMCPTKIETFSSTQLKQKRTSKFRGVSCCGKDRKWQARIRESNRVRYLGRFQTEVEAALVYDEASRQCKGNAAPTNFVKMDADTMQKLRDAYEKLGYVPASLEHLMANPRKTKPKKNSEKRPYKKRNTTPTSVSTMPSTPNGKPKDFSALSQQAIAPAPLKMHTSNHFEDERIEIPSRAVFSMDHHERYEK